MPVAFAVAALVEVVAVHLLVSWLAVRVIMDVIGIYGLVTLLGWLAGQVVYPHTISDSTLYLRIGWHRCAAIPRRQITSVYGQRCLSPTSPCLGNDPSGVSVLILAGPNGTSATIRLASPIAVSLPTPPWKRARPAAASIIRLNVDDPEDLLHQLNPLPRR